MKLISSSHAQGGRTTGLSIQADKGEDLAPFESMLIGHQWVRMNEQDELETAPAHKDPPIKFDKDIDPIWGDGEPQTIRQLVPPKKGETSKYSGRSFFVQSIAGYSGNRVKKAQQLYLCGFEPLRSRRGTDGKIWEIWYLPGAWAAKYILTGKTEEQILDWLCNEISPGTIALSGETWGLSME